MIVYRLRLSQLSGMAPAAGRFPFALDGIDRTSLTEADQLNYDLFKPPGYQ